MHGSRRRLELCSDSRKGAAPCDLGFDLVGGWSGRFVSASVICRYVQRMLPKPHFTAVILFQGLLTSSHPDSYNEPGRLNAALPLAPFNGGNVWIADPTGDTPPCPDPLRYVPGQVLGWPAIFDPRNLHYNLPMRKSFTLSPSPSPLRIFICLNPSYLLCQVTLALNPSTLPRAFLSSTSCRRRS